MSFTERFNVSAWSLQHRALVCFVFILATLAGFRAYTHLAQSEDPPFTFRVMVVQSLWPGASAQQVQEQVTQRIERTLQELPNLYYTQSYTKAGESAVFYAMNETVPVSEVREEWYQVRKHIDDIRHDLPRDLVGPFFLDDFGDVYSTIYALKGQDYSWRELKDQADLVRSELLNVDGVAKVSFFGEQDEYIAVEVSNTQLASLGLSPQQLAQTIAAHNQIQPSGVLTTPSDRLQVRLSGLYEGGLATLKATPLTINGTVVPLSSVATIERRYNDPADPIMRSDGENVLGIGVTVAQGYSVVKVGKALAKVQAQLHNQLQAGLELVEVASMPDAVTVSVNEFLRAVAEAVIIVLVVSLLSLGLRMGTIVVVSIPVVLALTALLMSWFGIGLHKVSLGTLVLALGLLVDDAILAIEMMAVKLDQGWSRAKAAAFAYTSTAFPMLTGTLVTIAGFLPIALAQSSTGEYTRSIFEVSAISLLVSWVVAIVLIPVLGYYLLRTQTKTNPSASAPAGQFPASTQRHASERSAAESPDKAQHTPSQHTPSQLSAADEAEAAVYQTPFYNRLRVSLAWCVRHRMVVVGGTLVLFVASLFLFTLIPQQFFPDSDRPELIIDLRLAENASIAATTEQVERLDARLAKRPEVKSWLSYIGRGSPRFYLPLDEQLPQDNLAQVVITAHSLEDRERLFAELDTLLEQEFSEVRTRLSRLESGPPVGYPVQIRVSGTSIEGAQHWAQEVAALVRNHPDTRNVQFDWDEPASRRLQFQMNPVAVAQAGLSREGVAQFLALHTDGMIVSEYREQDYRLPIKLRAPAAERQEPAQLAGLSVPTPQGAVPLGSLGQFVPELEYGIIWERDRQPTITVRADVQQGVEGIVVTEDLQPELAQLRQRLPLGYSLTVGGAVEESNKAQASIKAQMPLMVVVVLLLLMVQLQRFSRVLLVVFTAPLGLIGVALTLFVFRQPFGFVALLGVIAMFGIIMRNSVILVDQIEQDIAAGHPRGQAILDATVRRFRPITLTAAASVLGLIPLLRSNFFGPMASALMGGISSATMLTIFVLPALYALAFRVPSHELVKERS